MPDILKNHVKINISNLLTFFDESPPGSRGHALAVESVAGEDLGAGIFKYFLESGDTKVTILDERPVSEEKNGYKLSRWIETVNQDGSGCCYQTEIKTWSAHAMHGETLPLTATRAQERLHKIKQWENIWNSEINRPRQDSVAKVLAKMQNPARLNHDYPIHPLLIFWDMLHPLGADNFFFEQPVGASGPIETAYKSVWVFSISGFLRSLAEKNISIYMPDTAAKLKWLSDIFSASF
jgi:hypothetical protein